jgi:tetratricopeptide (TPR) repeat protein
MLGLGATWLIGAMAVSATVVEAEDDVQAAYRTLVERSCVERDRALQALARWSPQTLEEVRQKLERCDECEAIEAAEGAAGEPLEEVGKKVQGCEDCAPPRWEAAAALHTVRVFTTAPGPDDLLHLSHAEWLLTHSGDKAFLRRWYLTVGLGCLFRVEPASARSYLRKGLEGAEDDPALLVALGASYEAEEWRQRLVAWSSGHGGPTRARQEREWMAEQSRFRTEAAGLFEKALARDPRHPEAHLRLGRLELLLGRSEEGLTKLQWVTEHARELDLVYLAHLFLGRAHEEAGQLDAALASYRAALAVDPGGQAASVATSHALHARGELAAAAEILEQGLAARRRRRTPDAWWSYPEGRPGQLPALMAQLFEEACR